MVRKTKAEAQETRHQILDAAEQVFLQHGVARTSLQDIAGAAGLTRGAIYWHFEDKAALFTAMMDRVVLPCEMALAEALAGEPAQALPELELLALLPLRELATQEAVQRVFRIAMHFTEYTDELAAVRERHQASIDEFTRQLRELLDRAQQAGTLPPSTDTAAAALGLFALVDGLMRHWTLAPGGFDLMRAGRVSVSAYLAGLRQPC
jgi:TetR/AcrR family transcriptional regulator, acrAB operon repressor